MLRDKKYGMMERIWFWKGEF